MLDNFREWLSDNLRYVLLGLAVILLIAIAFFAVRLIGSIGSSGSSDKKEQETQAVTEQETEGQNTVSENKLTQEAADSELAQLISQYYTAIAAKDYDTLASLCESFTESDKAEIEAASAVEAYSNLKVYSKKGLEDGEYIVYPYYDAKLTGIDTAAPSLRELYVVTKDGRLVIGDASESQARIDYISEHRADHDVQALAEDVNRLIEDAKANDSALASYVESLGSSAKEPENGEASNTGAEDNGSGTTMQATTGVNVRAEASADSALNGTLYAGMQVEVLENLDNGWSRIQYTANGTTIQGYVMTQYLGAVQ